MTGCFDKEMGDKEKRVFLVTEMFEEFRDFVGWFSPSC